MAETELHIVRLKDDFYRDGFYQLMIAFLVILGAIALLIGLFLYLIFSKPNPVNFSVDNEWRVLADVPVTQPYLKNSDLLQWVSEVLPGSFNYDFLHYNDQLKQVAENYTQDGWKKFLDQTSAYVNENSLTNAKLFMNGTAAGTPFIINQGLLEGRYAWWVQMPINIGYSSFDKGYTQTITIKALVIRTSTLNDLHGVAITNIIVTRGNGEQGGANG